MSPCKFLTRTENTIIFRNGKDLCKIDINVTARNSSMSSSKKDSWIFNITYTNTYEGDHWRSLACHPLHELAKDDESLLEGSYVAANPITFPMIECLLGGDTYYTGVVTENCYKGQVMRALTEMEV